MCVNCDLDKLHCVWLNHCLSQCFQYILRNKKLTFWEILFSVGVNFICFPPKGWEIRFLTLKMGVDLYTRLTYTRVNTVCNAIFSCCTCPLQVDSLRYTMVLRFARNILPELKRHESKPLKKTNSNSASLLKLLHLKHNCFCSYCNQQGKW